jgi:hypothetical protein
LLKEWFVVSKCANPFTLGKGTLFLLEVSSNPETSGGEDSITTVHKGPHRLETFWLCDHCSSTFIVRMLTDKAVIVPRDVVQVAELREAGEKSVQFESNGFPD